MNRISVKSLHPRVLSEIYEQLYEHWRQENLISGDELRLSAYPKSFTFNTVLDSIHSGHYQIISAIVETRCNVSRLKLSIIETARIFKTPIVIFCAKKNILEILEIIRELHDINCKIVEICEDISSNGDYNQLLKSLLFWNQLPSADKLLIFQADSLPCEKSDYQLKDFVSFDYIGGEWNNQRPCGLVVEGGIGGFSLRDIPMSKHIIRLSEGYLWPFGEDGFFAFFTDLLGGKVATTLDRRRFCSQHIFYPGCLAIHKLPKKNNKKYADSLEVYCPKWLSPETHSLLKQTSQPTCVSIDRDPTSLMTVDLGCGARPQNPFGSKHPYGVDCRSVTANDYTIIQSDLTIQPLPFEDQSVDAITAIDFLEHIPRLIYLPERRNSFVELMSDISRVLKPGGIFYSRTPCFPSAAAFKDPTHVNFITETTFKEYFDCRNRTASKASMYGYVGSLILEAQLVTRCSHLSVFFRKKVVENASLQSSLSRYQPWLNEADVLEFMSRSARRPFQSNELSNFNIFSE